MHINFSSKDIYSECVQNKYRAEKEIIGDKTIYIYKDEVSDNKIIFNKDKIEIIRKGDTEGKISLENGKLGEFIYSTSFFKKVFVTKCEYIDVGNNCLSFKYAIYDGEEIINLLEIDIGEGG